MAEQHPHSEGTERVRETIRDGFTIMLGAASWAFELGDRVGASWVRPGKVTREESRRRFDEFASTTRRRGEDLSRRVSESVRSSMPVATRDHVASLERQGGGLRRQIESMKSAGTTPSSSTPATRDRPSQS